MGLAVQLHDEGRCSDGIRQATAAWRQWITYHDPTAEGSVPTAVPLLEMLLACGRLGEAEAIIKTADLHRHAQDGPVGRAFSEFLAMSAAGRLLHCVACTPYLDRTLTAAGTAADRSA